MSAFDPDLTKETASDAVIALGDWISLHTGSPGTTGANEATGGSPAYARKQTTWSADVTDDGVRAGTQVTIDVAAATYTHFGVWSASSGGTYRGGGTITSTVMASQGQIKVTPTRTTT
jgi:hypothetical protein